jgi:TonB-linked outer membrane protein, SusC/RagA family
MRIIVTTLLLTAVLVSGFAGGLKAQRVTINKTHATLTEVIRELRRQSGYNFLFDKQLSGKAGMLSVQATDAPLQAVLEKLLAGRPLSFSINDASKSVVIREKPPTSSHGSARKPAEESHMVLAYEEVKGRVVDSLGHGLQGASVKVKGYQLLTKTDRDGYFTLRNVPNEATLEISFIGYISQEVKSSATVGTITLVASPSDLDEVMVIGYGQTSKRLNTGSVSTVSAEQIEQQPVTNVLSALSGRMPGVFVQTTNGLPGGNIDIQIRGTGSIAAGTRPLYIIDDVPFEGTPINENYAVVNRNISGATNPLNSLNPNDIESISVLKDADATAIYGSRGSNGVVLITTKRGRIGSTKINIDVQQGINRTANLPSLFNLEEYLVMRREAFANEDRTPSADPTSPDYAPDLTIWSQTEATDWVDYFLGNTGNLSNLQTSVSGGKAQTNFNIGAGYRAEGTIIPGDNRYNRTNMRASLQHRSENQRFQLAFNGNFSADYNKLANPSNSPNAFMVPPNYPSYNPDGSFNWYKGNNIVAESLAKSRVQTGNLVGNLALSYAIAPNLILKTSMGYNRFDLDQIHTFPSRSLYPGTLNYTDFVNNQNQSFIVEPQLDFNKDWVSSKLTVLLGATYQNRTAKHQWIQGQDFTNESLMENLGSAGVINGSTNNYTQYKYASAFGRVTYNLFDRYILNGTIRRDGSSRFGPGNRFGSFASIGAAWLFGTERWVAENLRFLSYGKLRGSYGTTGNDQISDYQYLSTYSAGTGPYDGIGMLQPSRIYNSDYRWELTRKFEAAIELGLAKDRVLLTAGYYDNRSDNQLVSYPLPRITGFSNYQANLPATVQNKGWEFELSSDNIQRNNFTWTTNVNLTLPKNVLLSFENFETSSYRNTHEIGYDITRIFGYQFLGINSESGLAQYTDQDGEISSSPYNFHTLGKRTPDFYGGIGNSFRYKNIRLDVFGQFSKQQTVGGWGFHEMGFSTTNSYALFLNRWTKPGDVTDLPKASVVRDTYYQNSSANVFDVMYFRLKNVALSYTLPEAVSAKIKSKGIMLYSNAQNLFTVWDRNIPVLDPESGARVGSNRTMPPVMSFIFGLNVTF